uniref:Uncharacterized protein n=1 Tax=Chenopodium quinoa TaxID=63459 RepID=A0A803MVC8_CHEQI
MREESQLSETVGGIMDANMEDGARLSSPKNFNQAEPKYRFVNRRRPGSIIFMSRKDYLSIKQGKSYHFFNSNQGSFMFVRIATKAKNFSKDEENQENVQPHAPSTFIADQEQPQGGEASVISEDSGKRVGENQERNDIFIECKGEASGGGTQNRIVNEQQPNIFLCRSGNGSFSLAPNPEQFPKKFRVAKARSRGGR